MYLSDARSVIGTVTNDVLPPAYKQVGGVGILITNMLRLVFVAAGVWAFLNVIIAGFQYMTAGGDSKKLASAWDRIWQSFVGLIIMIGSFAIAAILGQMLFGRADFILDPKLYGVK